MSRALLQALATGWCHVGKMEQTKKCLLLQGRFVGGVGMFQKRGLVEVARPTIRVCLEGNIAAGKSTLLDIMNENFSVYCVPEPVSRWQNVSR